MPIAPGPQAGSGGADNGVIPQGGMMDLGMQPGPAPTNDMMVPAAGAGGTGGDAAGGAPTGGTGGDPDQGSAGGGAGGGEGGAGGTPEPQGMDEMPWFTFFTTSEEGIRELAPDPENGFGGDLGGLAGADQICDTLAKKANPTDQKVWRAFLSATDDGNGNPVHAIERIGQGPWRDFNDRLLAEDVAGLMPEEGMDGGRPVGADPQLAEMFTDEFGRPVSPDTSQVDNHDMLTGSDSQGRLMGDIGDTCQDWTSNVAEGNGEPRIGHAWPRSDRNGRNWMSEHTAGGCAPGIDTEVKAGNGTPTVGSGGGYGGFYCFAVTE